MKITANSHLDHALPPEVVAFIAERYANQTSFLIETIDLPEGFEPVSCILIGPSVGLPTVDEARVTYEVRGPRRYASRMCASPKSLSRQVTVIMGEHEGEAILFTAYGGPCAPREPGDPSITSWEELQASRKFWSEHALSNEILISREG
jgi:hypothetical protein